jgi:NAD(P)-dependent dehydrogenase (short-subunit alcohol dehydrogenase family)
LTPRALAVGIAFGAAAMSGHALLLYTGAGFLRAAGFLIAVSFASAAAGWWAGSTPRARSRPLTHWVVAVGALVIAGIMSALWTATTFRDSMFGGALGTLFLVAEPCYAAGALFALLVNGRAGHGPAILIGIGLGILLASSLLIPRMQAPGVFAAAAATVLGMGLIGRSADAAGEEREDDMNGKVAIVTGVGARGQVGYTVAERFLRAGARVVITGRSEDVHALADQLSGAGEVASVAADLMVDDDVARIVAVAQQRFGRVDTLVNVAGGLSVIKPLADTSPEEWRREIQRNAETALRTCRAVLPLLRESGGAIVNFASPAGLRALKSMGAYSAAKAAVVALTRSLALEEKVNGVRANAIAPGMIDTEQNRRTATDPDQMKFVTRDEIADVALFLASNASSGISGETIHVMGESLR